MPPKSKAKETPEPTPEPTPTPPTEPEPSEINSALDSDRMKALLADHRKMGARP